MRRRRRKPITPQPSPRHPTARPLLPPPPPASPTSRNCSSGQSWMRRASERTASRVRAKTMPWKAGSAAFSSSTRFSARNLGWLERPAKAHLEAACGGRARHAFWYKLHCVGWAKAHAGHTTVALLTASYMPSRRRHPCNNMHYPIPGPRRPHAVHGPRPPGAHALVGFLDGVEVQGAQQAAQKLKGARVGSVWRGAALPQHCQRLQRAHHLHGSRHLGTEMFPALNPWGALIGRQQWLGGTPAHARHDVCAAQQPAGP